MIFTKTSEYAIRALSHMARQDQAGPVGVKDVSAQAGVPAAYVAKLFQGLVRSGILRSERGARGGFVFRKDPSSITLYDVVKITDDLAGSTLSGCVMGLKHCSDRKPCALHHVWARSREQITAVMRSTSLTDASTSMDKRTLTLVRRGGLSRQMRNVWHSGRETAGRPRKTRTFRRKS